MQNNINVINICNTMSELIIQLTFLNKKNCVILLKNELILNC